MITGKLIQKLKQEWHWILILLMAAGLMFYAGYRAYHLSFTHDESFCYSRYVTHSFYEIVSYAYPTANNHILNTLLMKLFSGIFGPSEFVLRLPNVLALLMYIFFTVLLLKKLKHKLLMVGGFIVFNFNPYLLEFFSLGRGYGLSAAFMLGSMYYILEYSDKKQQKQVYLAMIFGMLALYSNFVLIHYFVSVIIICNLLFISEVYSTSQGLGQRIKNVFKKNIPVFIVLAISVYISYEPVRKLVKFNELYGRGQNGFWNDTVLSFVHGSFYGVDYHYDMVRLFMILTIAMIFIATVFFIREFRLQNFNLHASKGIIFLLLLLLPAFSTIAQHFITGSEYLIYRTTLFFQPLLALTLVYLLIFSTQISHFRIAGSIIGICIISFMVIHTARAFNLEKSHEWDYDAMTKNMVSDLEQAYIADALSNRATPNRIHLGINWIFEPSVNYYRLSRNIKWLNEVNRNGVETPYDFYYVFQDDTAKITHKMVLKEYLITFDGRPVKAFLIANPNRYSAAIK